MGEHRGPRRARVLVVEDDADSRAALVAALAELDADVVTAADGAEGLGAVRRVAPNLVLLDLGLPRLSGVGVAQRLKGDPATAGIPLIAVSGLLRMGDAAALRGLGVDAYVAKPFVVDDLVAVVRTWLVRGSRIGGARRPRPEGPTAEA